ncbi:MAG: hypothetical protein AMXMBFR52_23850 [Burkholderiales bacterium]
MTPNNTVACPDSACTTPEAAVVTSVTGRIGSETCTPGAGGDWHAVAATASKATDRHLRTDDGTLDSAAGILAFRGPATRGIPHMTLTPRLPNRRAAIRRGFLRRPEGAPQRCAAGA